MYCIFCPNIISWRKVHRYELQLLYGNVQTRGAERWFFFTLRLDNCSCKSKRWTHMAAVSPAWPSTLKLGMNLVAAHYATSFRTVHIRVLPYLEFSSHWILITLSRDTRHNSDVPSIGWRSWIAFHFPLPKKAAMLSQPMIEFTPRRAPQEAVVNIAWVELHIMFHVAPFQSQLFAMSKH